MSMPRKNAMGKVLYFPQRDSLIGRLIAHDSDEILATLARLGPWMTVCELCELLAS